jgi:hypothetical protein
MKLVGHNNHNPRVGGSSPSPATNDFNDLAILKTLKIEIACVFACVFAFFFKKFAILLLARHASEQIHDEAKKMGMHETASTCRAV